MRKGEQHQQRMAELHHREALETFRTLVNLERQAWSVFAATDVLLVAYGLYIKLAGPVAFGILVLVALLISSVSVHRHLVPVGYVIFANEKILAGGTPLGITYAASRTPGLLEAYERISQSEVSARPDMLKSVGSGAIGSRSVVTITILIAAQVALVTLTVVSGYKFF
ncbi:hypothetical protein [Microbacterium sp. LWO12-1.2]|uniref:hypothetical protein n=1 Tax=Microbacterium sp. LWO12-1.2 TaxID=3135261 RepID=UPI00341E9C08